MNKGLKFISYIITVIIITFILCVIFIRPKGLNLKTTEEYVYIENNKNNIEEVIVKNETQLGISCYKIDTSKAYEIINNIEIKKEIGFCSAPNLNLEFHFKDKTTKTIKFECDNLFYNDKRYELKEPIILYNKDEYIPDKITKGMIIVSNKDKIECK